MVCRVFQPDPQKRISLAALRRHPWLTGSAPQLQPSASPAPSSIAIGSVCDIGLKSIQDLAVPFRPCSTLYLPDTSSHEMCWAAP